MVMMTLLAMVPQVISCTSGSASSSDAAVWVAPNSMAFSRLFSSGSMATIRLAPASLAPWMALAPMPPTPTTTTVSPGRDLGGVDRRAPAGDDAAAEQAGPVERDVVVDLDAAGLVDDRVVAEGAEQAHEPEVLALGVVARGAVGDLQAEAQRRAQVAQVLVAGGAARAAAARRDEAEHDVVARLQPADALADLLHDAGALVAADDRQREGQVAR